MVVVKNLLLVRILVLAMSIVAGFFLFTHTSLAGTIGSIKYVTKQTLVAVHGFARPAVASSPNGVPMVAYEDYTNGRLKFITCDDRLCANPVSSTLATIAGNTSVNPSIAQSADGNPSIAYTDHFNHLVKFMKCYDVSCTASVVYTLGTSTGSSVFVSMTIGADGYPIVAYGDDANGLLKFVKCGNVYCSATTSNMLDTLTAATINYPSLALGADGLPVVAYQDYTNGLLKLIKCHDDSCATTTIRTLDTLTPGASTFPSLTIGTDGFPIIAYEDVGSGFLKFVKCADDSCATTAISTLVSQTAGLEIYPSIALGTNQLPVISYTDVTNGFLKYIDCRDPSCSVTVIRTPDSAVSGNVLSAVARSSDGSSLIVYNHVANNQLKYARISTGKTSLKTHLVTSLATTIDVTGTYASRRFQGTASGKSLVNDADKPFFASSEFFRCTDVLCTSFASSSSFLNDSVVLNSNGLPFASYSYTYGDSTIHANACLDATCTAKTDTTLYTATGVFYVISDSIPQIGGDGFPSIVYQDSDTNAMEFIHCTNVACTTHAAIVDLVSPRQYHTSFVFGGDGFPVMAYDDTLSTSGTLKYTHCADLGCGSFTNSSLGASTWGGSAIAMAKGSDGKPVIFYSSADGNGVLLKCKNYSCTTSTSVVLTNSTSSVASITINEKGFPNIVAETSKGVISLFYCRDLECGSHDTNTIFDYADVPAFVPPGTLPDSFYKFDSVSLAKDSVGLPMLVVGFQFYTNQHAFPYRYVHQETDYIHCDTVRCGTNASIGNLYTVTTVGGSQIGTARTGLIGYWTFNGKDFKSTGIADISGNANTAYFRGGATTTGMTAGKIGQGLNLNGTTNYLMASTSNTLNIATNTMSMTAWVKRATSSSAGVLLTRGSGATGYSFAIGNPCTVDQVKMTKLGVTTSCLSSFPTDTRWHHLALTYGSGGAQLYVDGTLLDTIVGDTSSVLSASGQTLCIAATCVGANPFPGTLDEVRIYDRTLTALDVKQLYLGGR